MGRPESANHGSTKNKSKSFQASRRAGRAVRKRESEGAGRTRRSGAVPAGLHWSSQLPVCRRAALQSSGLGQRIAATNKDLARSNNKGEPGRGTRRSAIFRGACAPRVPPSSGKRKWRRRTDVWREATSPARGFRRLTSDGSAAHSSGAANWRSPRCGVSALPVFLRPLAARVRAEAEHELAPSRSVFRPLPACSAYRSHGAPGDHLRMHPELSQAETAGSPEEGQAARWAPA